MGAGSVAEGTATADLGVERALFVYGVLPRAAADRAGIADGLTGLDGAPVELVPGGTLAAAVSVMTLDRPPGRRAELLGYQSVVDALAEQAPVAPVRFGSVLADTGAVVDDLLLPDQERFERVLGRLAGRRQYNLRATYREEAVLAELVATDPEIRALRDRTRDLPEEASYQERVRLGELVAHALEDRSAYDASVLLDPVLPLVADHVVRTPPSASQVLDVALLVEEDRAGEVVDRLEGLAEAVHERIRMSLLGPLAAYDFVAEAGWD